MEPVAAACEAVDAAGCSAVDCVESLGMMYRTPLVLKEAMNNSTTRVAFEGALARSCGLFPGSPILMYNSDHVGALQQAAIPLRQTINEGDYDSFQAALAAPAEHAAYVVAIAGDPVSSRGRGASRRADGVDDFVHDWPALRSNLSVDDRLAPPKFVSAFRMDAEAQ